MKLQSILEKHWYKNNNLLLFIILLLPSILFFIISKIRYYCYKLGIFKSYKLPVPVIIIGNITVGGTGKTPLTQYLAHELNKNNIAVGIILRGYKSSHQKPLVVKSTHNSTLVGDEALIYAYSNIPVAIGIDRYQTGLTLLKVYPHLQLILSDDGMQHYKLQRDYEIAVIDSTRILGNNFILPLGPLREPTSRLNSVNAIVINSDKANYDHQNVSRVIKFLNQKLVLSKHIHINIQTLTLYKIFNLVTKKNVTIDFFDKKNVIAIAAIGNPERYFTFLSNLGINTTSNKAYPDHHYFSNSDIPTDVDVILVTKKDYTKLKNLNNDKIWVIEVVARLDNDHIVKTIKNLI